MTEQERRVERFKESAADIIEHARAVVHHSNNLSERLSRFLESAKDAGRHTLVESIWDIRRKTEDTDCDVLMPWVYNVALLMIHGCIPANSKIGVSDDHYTPKGIYSELEIIDDALTELKIGAIRGLKFEEVTDNQVELSRHIKTLRKVEKMRKALESLMDVWFSNAEEGVVEDTLGVSQTIKIGGN